MTTVLRLRSCLLEGFDHTTSGGSSNHHSRISGGEGSEANLASSARAVGRLSSLASGWPPQWSVREVSPFGRYRFGRYPVGGPSREVPSSLGTRPRRGLPVPVLMRTPRPCSCRHLVTEEELLLFDTNPSGRHGQRHSTKDEASNAVANREQVLGLGPPRWVGPSRSFKGGNLQPGARVIARMQQEATRKTEMPSLARRRVDSPPSRAAGLHQDEPRDLLGPPGGRTRTRSLREL